MGGVNSTCAANGINPIRLPPSVCDVSPWASSNAMCLDSDPTKCNATTRITSCAPGYNCALETRRDEWVSFMLSITQTLSPPSNTLRSEHHARLRLHLPSILPPDRRLRDVSLREPILRSPGSIRAPFVLAWPLLPRLCADDSLRCGHVLYPRLDGAARLPHLLLLPRANGDAQILRRAAL